MLPTASRDRLSTRGLRALRWLHGVEDAILALALTCMIVLAATQIFLRNFLDTGIVWADPFLRILVLWVAMLGALSASRGNRQITVDIVPRLVPERARPYLLAFSCLTTAAVSAVIAFHAGRYVLIEMEAQTRAVFDLPGWVPLSIIPFAFGAIALRYLLLTALALKR